MRSHLTQGTIRRAVAAVLIVAAAGCADDDDIASEEGGTAPAASESAYCDAAVDWAVHDMTPFDDSDPAEFRAYWEAFLAFEAVATDTAPDEIKADWELKVTAEADAGVTEVFEKYGYDVATMEASGTPEELAAFEAPPEVQAAQDRILGYESAVCGSGQPQAADVSYAGEEPGPYCELVAVKDELAADALASGDSAEVEAVFGELEQGADALIEAAPEIIEDDVVELAAWTTGRQRDVAEHFDYDLRAAMQDGTAQDRFDLNHADEEIREQYARVLAYEEQVCGG